MTWHQQISQPLWWLQKEELPQTRQVGCLLRGANLHAGLTLCRVDMVFEAAALRLMAGHIICKVLAGTAGTWGFLLKALSQGSPVVGVPVLATVTSRPSSISVQVEKLTHPPRPL